MHYAMAIHGEMLNQPGVVGKICLSKCSCRICCDFGEQYLYHLPCLTLYALHQLEYGVLATMESI